MRVFQRGTGVNQKLEQWPKLEQLENKINEVVYSNPKHKANIHEPILK